MAENKGTKVIAPIVTPSTDDKFPTHISNMGKGGYHSVQSLSDRDAIPTDRREEGMLCGVVSEGVVYQLVGGLENTFWNIFTVGGTDTGTTNADAINYSPTGELTGINVQSALDELEVKKADVEDVFTKAETQSLVDGLSFDYNELSNSPNLDSLHEHSNSETLDKFSESQGSLVWNGQTFGDMFSDIYDSDKDGLVDVANITKGGYHSVQSIADRDAIPMDLRKEGMLCGVITEKIVYQLIGGIDNAFWEIFTVGAGGSTSASSLNYSPTGGLTGTNVQTALDELELKKANLKDIYTKAETQTLVADLEIDYNNLKNLPDLDKLHEHTNMPTLNKFTESQGDLVWNGKTLGNMIADMYDSDKDGLVDVAKTLEGLNVPSNLLNHTAGLTGNIQQQINAISSGTVFKGEFDTYAEMIADLNTPEKGYWVFIVADENHSGAKTQYYHDGNEWIYGGGSSQTPSATDVVKGSIMLQGALFNPNGSAENPLLSDTGVVEGLYKSANIVVGKDGRITHAEEGSTAFINDDITNELETWSSQKISDSLFGKSPSNHSHAQLHDSNVLGDVRLDVKTKSDKRVITYNAITGQAEWQESAGGKVYVGSKVINGDYRLVAGSYINLFIDETAKTITINGLPSGSGGVGGVPTLTEITHTLIVSAGSTERISLDSTFNKYDLRTLEAKSENEEIMSVNVYDQAVDGRKVYYSNKEKYIYDIVNVPIHDKDDSKQIHLEVSNHSVTDATVSLTISITNLI